MLTLEQAGSLSPKPVVRFAALVHDLGKGLTPKEIWPHHYDHEKKGLSALEGLCQRLRVPNAFKNLAQQVMRYHSHCHRSFDLRPSTLTDTLSALGAFKAKSNLDDFLLACEADAKGRSGMETNPYPQADLFRAAAKAAQSVDISAILNANLKGQQIGEAIRRLRIKAVSRVLAEIKSAALVD